MNISLLASAIETLLGKYGIGEIIIIVILFALAVKEVITLIDWFKNRGKTKFKEEEAFADQDEQIKLIREAQKAQREEIRDIKNQVEMLITANKNDIKAWIIEKYHQVMKQGWVNDYDLDLLERRYLDYKQAGGNSYVEDLMEDIRKLPKTSRVE